MLKRERQRDSWSLPGQSNLLGKLQANESLSQKTKVDSAWQTTEGVPWPLPEDKWHTWEWEWDRECDGVGMQTSTLLEKGLLSHSRVAAMLCRSHGNTHPSVLRETSYWSIALGFLLGSWGLVSSGTPSEPQ